MHLSRSSSNVPRLPSFLEILQNRFSHFWQGAECLAPAMQTTSERPKVFRTPQFLALLTSKCASRHNGVHFFDISTSKSGPNLVCFVHFDLETPFFDIATSKSAPELRCFVPFPLGNVFRATTARTFSTSQGPKVL